MGRKEALTILTEHEGELRERFGVTSLRLFGSTAREEAVPGSDVDILVSFASPPSLIEFLRVRSYLEDLLGAPVDLVKEDGLKPRAHRAVEQDAILAAERTIPPRE